MVRIAYFGTDGCPGHHVIPIRGKFTEEDIKVIESVDCDDFYKVFDVMRFKIAEFKGWTILGIPASLDDHRPGSKTVIFIEGEANEADFIEVTQEYSFLKNKVKKLAELYHDGEWPATGKLNQDPPTNKERFQFTLDKDDIINMTHGPVNIPSGTVFCGLRHCSIISQLAAYGIAHKNRSVQGFLTSKNRFLTREEASELVRNNNQEMVVDRNAIREQLYSEDLY